MKLGYILENGAEEFAVSEDGRHWRALSSLGIVAHDTAAALGAISAIDTDQLWTNQESRVTKVSLRYPVVRPSKIVAIGANYRDHIREMGLDVPERPLVFAKFPNSLSGPFDDIVISPDLTEMGDYEAELAVVIGRKTRRADRREALSAIAGYCVANDVSARDWQFADKQYDRSKGFDTFLPIGPWITTADEVDDPQKLEIRSYVNDELRQDASTSEMIFSVAEIVSFLSTGITLEPGDVILTGTPFGTGFALNPRRSLATGDIVRCEIIGLGAIENRVDSVANTGRA